MESDCSEYLSFEIELKIEKDMKYYTQEQKFTLVYWGFDPDKPVADMTLGELYSLMKFAINRRGETS